MFDKVATTFYNNVVAAYDEYVACRDSPAAGRDRHLRTAIAAATSLYHFREHLPDNLRATVKGLEQTSEDFALMRGVSNAAKHKQVTRHQPLVAEAAHMTEVTVIVRYADEQGDYSHVQTIIEVACTDMTTCWLDLAITRTLNMWGGLLKDAGICGYGVRREPDAPGSRYLSRTEASTNLNLEAMRGLDLHQSMRLLIFDKAAGAAVPIDLTGAEMQFRIYKPQQHIFDVTMSHASCGQVTVSIPLTPEENLALHRIENQADHGAFIEKLCQAHWTNIERKFRDQLSPED